MVETMKDVAREVMARYSQYKNKHSRDSEDINKKEKSVFVCILEDCFQKYGVMLKYSNLSEFKSVAVQSINYIRKSRKIGSNVLEPEEEFWETAQMKPRYHPKEGDGEIFTMDQVRRYDLNPESY